MDSKPTITWYISITNPQNHQNQLAVIDDQYLLQLQLTLHELTRFLPLLTNLPKKTKTLFFRKEFGELIIDGLIDMIALSGAILEAEIRKLRLLAAHTIINEDTPLEFEIMVANGWSESPITRQKLQFKVGDIRFRENFVVTTNFTSPLIALLFLQRNGTILDMRQRITILPSFQCNWKMKIGRVQM